MIRIAALALTILTVLTLPLSASKYAATGTGSAVARIAKWDVAFTQDPSSGNPLRYYNEGGKVGGDTRTFKIKNRSEVVADVTIRIAYVTKDNETVAASSPSVGANTNGIGNLTLTAATGSVVQDGTNWKWRFDIGAEAEFEITSAMLAKPSATEATGYRKYQVYFNAEQVD